MMTTQRRACHVRVQEVLSAQQLDPQRIEVAGADGVDLHEHSIAGRRIRAFWKHAAQEAAGERRVLRDRRMLDAGQAGQPLDRLLIKELTRSGV